MLDVFKARLKAKYPNIKFSDKRVNTIADKLHRKFPDATDEAAHDTAIDFVYDEADLVEIVKLDEVLDVKPKPPEPPKPAPPQEPEKPKTEIEKLTEIVTGLATTVQTLTAEKAAQSRTEKLKNKFEEKGVPEKIWNKMMIPEKDEAIDAWVEEVSKDYAEVAPKATFTPGKSNGNRGNGKPSETEINNLVDSIM